MIVLESTQLFRGDAAEVMTDLATELTAQVNLIIVDPPYFIGRGSWDPVRRYADVLAFHKRWLDAALPLLHPDGSIWVSGTFHSIHAIGHLLQSSDLRIVNEVTWEKPNPRPSPSQRCFVHATESLIWATWQGSSYRFNRERMLQLNDGRPMRAHWRFAPPRASERTFGRQRGQKPEALLERILLAVTDEGDLVLDPFLGSGTTAVVAERLGRRCIGIERDSETLARAKRRLADGRGARS